MKVNKKSKEQPIKKDYRLDLLALAISQHYRLVKEIIANNSLAVPNGSRHPRCSPLCKGEALLADKIADLIGAIAGPKVEDECRAYFKQSWMSGSDRYNFGYIFLLISDAMPFDNDTKYDAKARLAYFRNAIARLSMPMRDANNAPMRLNDRMTPPGEARDRSAEANAAAYVETTTVTVTHRRRRKNKAKKELEGQMLLFEETKEEKNEETQKALEEVSQVANKAKRQRRRSPSQKEAKPTDDLYLDNIDAVADEVERLEREAREEETESGEGREERSTGFDRISEYYEYAGIEE